MSDITVLKDQRDHLTHELALAAKYPQMSPYRNPGHVEGLRDELAVLDAELESAYQSIQAAQFAKANVRQVTPDGREAIDKAAAALEKATAEAEASIQGHAVKVRDAARARYEAELAAGGNARYHIIWGQARNRLVNTARQVFEN